MGREQAAPEPHTFLDVAAYFNEVEWRLLHEWQNELYNNVMKEIHQALISLGPLIATSVFSLRTKEKEDVYPMDSQDSGSGNISNHSLNDTIVNSDLTYGMKRNEKQYLGDLPDTGRRKSSDCLSTGFPFLNSDDLFTGEKKMESCLMDRPNTEEKEKHTDLSLVIIKVEEERYPKMLQKLESVEAPLAFGPSISVIIKEEEERYSKMLKKSESVEGITSPALILTYPGLVSANSQLTRRDITEPPTTQWTTITRPAEGSCKPLLLSGSAYISAGPSLGTSNAQPLASW
ncbi:zinc finger protein 282-like isoform X5 [Ambystoma mexicanum]|uniref:zinc finger protein 282-like isoform X5 n=1 Tax=Ambystoma mexicanum TaxID=8296 RepID=UPI0037E97113